jgi:hypothetical protein
MIKEHPIAHFHALLHEILRLVIPHALPGGDAVRASFEIVD